MSTAQNMPVEDARDTRARQLGVVILFCLFFAGPSPARSLSSAFPVCLDYHCDETRRVGLTNDEWQTIAALFSPGLSPTAERDRIAEAIASMERLVGAKTGTWRDLAENAAGAGEPGQLDCIAESMNSTTYLQLFEQAGWLRWHRVEPRARRQRWLFIIHWTAVIQDTQSKVRYAVDSWYRDNGMPPVTQPLDDWLQSDGPPDA